MGRRRKEVTSQTEVELVPEGAADVSMVEQEPAPESVIVAEYQEQPTDKKPVAWLVLEDKVVSLFGQMTTLPAGTVVSAGSYGPQGVKRILEQGVMLEPVSWA